MISPIDPASYWVKNSLPSDMGAMQRAPLAEVGMSYSPIKMPSGPMRPILLATVSRNQIAPSGPATMGASLPPSQKAFAVTGKCVIAPAVLARFR